MDKDEIKLGDIKRILFGQAPPQFLLETFVRTFIIYIALIYTVRWLGKRMSGQLTINEMAVLLTLGAIVSVAMQVPDRGLLQGFLLLAVTLLFQRGIGWLGFKSEWFEHLTQGSGSLLVKNGVLQLKEMKRTRISKQQIFAELRQSGTFNLGMVDRLYLEAGGVFSMYKADPKRPGLQVLPPDDKDLFNERQPIMQLIACINCGFVTDGNKESTCEDCGHSDWIEAT